MTQVGDLKVITFYDFASTKESTKAWNPNCWKTRYSLNYKGLPYKTIWLEYPDVEPTLKAAGIAPTSTKPDGSPMYTIPAIEDPNTGTAIAESFVIAQYLDKTYPDKPTLIPAGTKALQSAFANVSFVHVAPILQFAYLIMIENVLNPKSRGYFCEARKNDILRGVSIEDAYPRGERAKEEWGKVKAGFETIANWMNKEDGRFVMGDTVSFADFVVGGWVQMAKKTWDEDSQEWKDISTWNGGRWPRLLEDLEKYASIA
ncbi:hypothetical protein K435DRAFT_826912 [Dendrothele bispora CBS 962.96]|uniref:GST N-terminal domain-containing protein n=1 Tax=Dendrothele bispora (strain CBS 962.96) TaxID=1314807 RepID=A0A4V4HHW4_DENBC|nr:hypothetical protein K435DRAFT_826912 [Dendrothele bispora CBS 962.96]